MHGMKAQSNSNETSSIEALRREFGIVFDPSGKVSQFGGIEIFLEFLRRGGFEQRLKEKFGSQKSRTILQLLIAVIVGAKSMEEVARIGRDPVVSRFLKKGLVGPISATQLARDLKGFGKSQIEDLHRFVSSISLGELAQSLSRGSRISIDVDATAVEKFGYQEGVETGFIEKDKIEPCYQYLFFRVHELHTILYGTIRGGAAHSQNGFCDYLRRFLPELGEYYRTTWRMDSGYFSEESLDMFSAHDATVFVKAPMSRERLGLVSQEKDWVWKRDPKTTDSELASVVTRTKEGTIYREVYKRTRLKKDQLSLLEETSFRYDCLVTNDLVMEEVEVYRSYNPRAGIENINREIKNDYNLGQLVTDDFDSNDVITQVTILAFTLMSHIKRNYLPKEMSRFQLQTLRWRLFQIPGRILWSARQSILRIANVFTGVEGYLNSLRSIRDSQSWVMRPPPTPQFSL